MDSYAASDAGGHHSRPPVYDAQDAADEDEELRAAALAYEAGHGSIEDDEEFADTFGIAPQAGFGEEDSDIDDELQVYEEEGSSDDWRPSEASDAGLSDSDEDRPRLRNQRRAEGQPLGNQAAIMMDHAQPSSMPEGGSVGLTQAQLRNLGFDNMGSNGLIEYARHKRQDGAGARSNAVRDGIEADELNRLMAGFGGESDVLNSMDLDTAGSYPADTQTSTAQLEQEEGIDNEGFRHDLEGISSFKKTQKKIRRVMQEQALSREVKNLLSDANIAYVSGETEAAIAKLQEIIRIEPTVHSAWATLALCFKDQGDRKKEIQAKIVTASLAPKAIDPWIDIAHESMEMGDYEQAIYCFDQAVKASGEKDKSDVLDAMWDRAVLLRDLQEPRKAILAFNHLLRVRPHNHDVLSELIPLLISVGRAKHAIKLLQESRAFNRKHFPNPQTQDGQRFATYRGSEVVTLADLLLQGGQSTLALQTLKEDARWLQGRASDTFWDEVVEDDREFDEARDDTRSDAPRYGRRVDLAPAYGVLDAQIRLRLGCARVDLGEMAEAERHFEYFFLHTDPAESFDDWMLVTGLYIEERKFERAMVHLEHMTAFDFLESPALYIKVGICHQALGNLEAAHQCFDAVLQSDPTNLDVKMRLAEVYEERGDRDEALRLVKEVIATRQMNAAESDGHTDPTAVSSRNAMIRLENPGLGLPIRMEDFQTPERPRPQSLHSRRSRPTMRADEIERLERDRDEEVARAYEHLRFLDSKVFVDGWWRSDVTLSEPPKHRPSGFKNPCLVNIDGSTEEQDLRWTATRQWLEEALRLVESFLSTSYLFPRESRTKTKKKGKRDRQPQYHRRRYGVTVDASQRASDLMARIQDNMLGETMDAGQDDRRSSLIGGQSRAAHLDRFRDLDFDQWTELLMKCAFVLTKTGDYTRAVSMLQEAATASVFVGPKEHCRAALKLCLMSCALYTQQHLELAQGARYFLYRWQFSNVPIRLHTILANATGFYGLDLFGERRLAKMLVRRSRAQDAIVAGRKWVWSRHDRRYVVQEKLHQNRSERNKAPRWRAVQEGVDDGGHDDEDLTVMPSVRRGDDDDDDGDDEEDLEDEFDDADMEDARASRFVGGGAEGAVEPPDGAETSVMAFDGPVEALEKIPTKANPLTELHYGYLLLVGSSYQAALSYFLRAYSRSPVDPLICLVAACACLGRMTNRQVDNRHHLLLQGLSFLTLYRKLRGGAPLAVETGDGREDEGSVPASGTPIARGSRSIHASMEAAYNIGRAYHSVGLFHLAVPQYQAVLAAHDGIALASPEASSDASHGNDGGARLSGPRLSGFDPYREAAHNLSLLLSINGNVKGARVLMSRYLRV
ncbi:unnamed protein product [Parajaminaea phylloscopi]